MAHKAGELALIWAGGQSSPGQGGGWEGRRGNAGTRLTEAFMSEGASQGPAVSLCKDGGDLCHLGCYSPGNGSHPSSLFGDFKPADVTSKCFDEQCQ